MRCATTRDFRSEVISLLRWPRSGRLGQTLEPIAERIRKLTGASFIVVANRQGVRYSHPNPALIGTRLTDGAIPLSGRTWVGVQNGSLGRSMTFGARYGLHMEGA